MAASCEVKLQAKKGGPFYAQLRSVCAGTGEEEKRRSGIDGSSSSRRYPSFP